MEACALLSALCYSIWQLNRWTDSSIFLNALLLVHVKRHGRLQQAATPRLNRHNAALLSEITSQGRVMAVKEGVRIEWAPLWNATAGKRKVGAKLSGIMRWGGGYRAWGANKGRMREMEKIKQDSLRVFEFPFLRCCVFHGPLTPRSTQMFQGWGLLSPEPRWKSRPKQPCR